MARFLTRPRCQPVAARKFRSLYTMMAAQPPDGRFTYTPNPDYTGNDAFTFRVSDGASSSEPETVSILVLEPGSTMVSTLTDVVNNTDGQTSLREALAGAEDGAVISFHPDLKGEVNLNGSELRIGKSLKLSGNGNPLTVSGSGSSRVFHIESGTVFISGITISEGNAPEGGGILNGGTLVLSNVLLVGNNASGAGGGILNGGTLTLSNTSLVGNTGNRGGGIANRGTLNLGNVTLFGNTAGVGGGVDQENGATLNLNNSIVAGNSAGQGGPDIYGTISSGDYNLVQNTLGATLSGSHDITGREAGLSALGYNGGPTQTTALLRSSPAINAGNPNFDGSPVDQTAAQLADQRGTGFPRVLNGRVDIGAYETTYLDAVLPTVTITSPVNRSFVIRLNSISGTASDDAEGSGITRVELSFKRNADGKYWNGTAWGSATPVALPAALNKGTWGLTASGLPSIMAVDTTKRLLPDDYTLFATAYDRADNQKSISNFFTVTLSGISAISAPAS